MPTHGVSAPAISLNVNMYCHHDAEVARERSRRAMHAFFASNVRHYEMADEHFAATEGYQRYAKTVALLRAVGLDAAAEAAAEVSLFGTPDQILRQIAGIKDVLGDFQLIVIPSFSGLPYDQAAQSLELFAKGWSSSRRPRRRRPRCGRWRRS